MQTTTGSLIPSNHWVVTKREEKGTIMKTDVFIKLFSNHLGQEEMKADIDRGFRMFSDFETQFSRFKAESELSHFNEGTGGVVSSDFFSLLEECSRFYTLTEGIFDPSVLPTLEKIGYKGSNLTKEFTQGGSFHQLVFDGINKVIQKPKDVYIDVGGIGKGYIVDKVANELSKKYVNGIVDAGGDMRLFGGDREQNLDTFAIDIENPFDKTKTLSMVLLSNCAIATSGTNRRKWDYAGQTYHHIIDPSREMSAETGVVQVTVIAPYAAEADVFAKTLLILGLERGMVFAREKNIPALFVTEDKKIIRNSLFQNYEWKT